MKKRLQRKYRYYKKNLKKHTDNDFHRLEMEMQKIEQRIIAEAGENQPL